MAALMTVILLLLPLVLIAIPPLTGATFLGPLSRITVITGFFVAVPLGFILVTAHRVAKYHGIIGSTEDTL